MSEVKELKELEAVIQNLQTTVNTISPTEVRVRTEKDFSKAADILAILSLKLQKMRVVSITEEDVEKEFKEEKDYYTAKEISDLFGVTVQGVYRWINEKKINFIPVYSPGSAKKVSEYRIPNKQFELNENPMIQRLNELRKIQELKRKMKWETVEIEEILPSSE